MPSESFHRPDFNPNEGLPPTERLRVCAMCRRPNCTDPSHRPEAHIETEKTPEGLERWFEDAPDTQIREERISLDVWSSSESTRNKFSWKKEIEFVKKQEYLDGPKWQETPSGTRYLENTEGSAVRWEFDNPHGAKDGSIIIPCNTGLARLYPDGRTEIIAGTKERGREMLITGSYPKLSDDGKKILASCFQTENNTRGFARIYQDGSADVYEYPVTEEEWNPSEAPDGGILVSQKEGRFVFWITKQGDTKKLDLEGHKIDHIQTLSDDRIAGHLANGTLLIQPEDERTVALRCLTKNAEGSEGASLSAPLPAPDGGIFAIRTVYASDPTTAVIRITDIIWIHPDNTVSKLKQGEDFQNQESEKRDVYETIALAPDGGLLVGMDGNRIVHLDTGARRTKKEAASSQEELPPTRKF